MVVTQVGPLQVPKMYCCSYLCTRVLVHVVLSLQLLLCKLRTICTFSAPARPCFSLSPGNENDMLPVFTQLEYEFVIRADAKVGLAIGNVIAIDGDAGKPRDPQRGSSNVVYNFNQIFSFISACVDEKESPYNVF